MKKPRCIGCEYEIVSDQKTQAYRCNHPDARMSRVGIESPRIMMGVDHRISPPWCPLRIARRLKNEEV